MLRVAHCRPDAGKGEGGLDAAIDALGASLTAEGVEVVPVRSREEGAAAQADLYHFHGLWHPWHSALARDLACAGRPYVVSPHGMLEPWAWKHKRWKKLPYFLLREKAYLAGAHALFATARPEAENLARFFPKARIFPIPLGLTSPKRPGYDAARAALGFTDKRSTLLYLSRLHEKKGLHLLLEALGQMRIKAFCRLVIVGGGDDGYVSMLKDIAEKHAATLPEVRWVGPVWGEDRWPFFQGADLFCLPTQSENFGLAVLEALQVGTRVLTTRATPWPSLLEGQPDAAFFCDPQVESIQSALMSFLRCREWAPASREDLAAWAHREFAWPRLASAYIRSYEAVLGRLAEDVRG